MSYIGSVPDTEPAREWLTRAACAGRHDVMFPDNNERGIAEAKAVCRPCPVWRECLADALRAGDNEHGIRGGMKPDERRKLARQQPAGKVTPARVPEPKQQHNPRPATLAEAFNRRTQRTKDGHVLWFGAGNLQHQGKRYTGLQAAFVLGHGRDPEGLVRRTCGTECFRWDHLIDGAIRDSDARCGTRNGYVAHRKRGEDACAPCRRANTDADNRLRRTGTSKKAAV